MQRELSSARRIEVGARIPPAKLVEVRGDAINEVTTHALFRNRHAVLVGVPGAFTPVCTEKHLPDYIASAERLSRGYGVIACLVANDPWTVAKWAKAIDPERRIRFLADGNLEFSRMMGLTTFRPDLHLGERTCRFLMTLNDGLVERLSVEPFVEQLTCTRPSALVLDI